MATMSRQFVEEHMAKHQRVLEMLEDTLAHIDDVFAYINEHPGEARPDQIQRLNKARSETMSRMYDTKACIAKCEARIQVMHDDTAKRLLDY